MSGQDQEVVITIRAKNLTAEEFAKAREQVTGLSKTTKDENEKAKQSFGGLKNTITETFNDPIGAVMKLTGSIGDGFVKSLSTGLVAVLGITAALVGAGGAMFELASRSAAVGAKLDDMADITGITVPALSGLKFAAEATGSSLDQVTNGIFTMQKRMAENPQDFEKGLKQIGLSMRDIENLNPDEQFIKISAAFKENTDQTNRASVALALFSKQGRDLIPLMTQPLGELVEKSKELGFTWTGEDAAAAEDFEIKVKTLKMEFANIFTVIGRDLIPVMSTLVDAFTFGYHATQKFSDIVFETTNPISTMVASVKTLIDTLQVLGVIDVKLPNIGGNAAKGVKAWKDSLVDLSVGIEMTAEKEKAAIAEVDKAIEDQRKTRDEAAKASAKAEEAAFAKRLAQFDNLYLELPKVRGEVIGLNYEIGRIGLVGQGIPIVTDLLAQFTSVVKIGTLETRNIGYQLRGMAVEGKVAATSLASSFQDALLDLPATITQAFAGGGNVLNAAGSFLGSALGKKVGSSLSDSIVAKFTTFDGDSQAITSGLGKFLGNAVSAALPIIGSLIGPVISKVGGWVKGLFGGPSQQEVDGRAAARDFEQFVDTMLTGQQRLQAGGDTWKRTVIGVKDAYLAAGYSAKEAEDAVAKMWQAEAAGPEQVKKVTEEMRLVFDQAKQDQADLNAAVQKYGFSIEELGPKFRQQKLDEQATLLMNDFRLLVGAGADVTLVLERMAGGINEFLASAIRTGAEVPAAMRPLLQQMVENGQLLDENGNKVEDLESLNLHYAQSMTEGFDRVVDALNRLLQGLGLIPAAAENAGRAIGNMPRPPAMPRNENGIEHFSDEGFVHRPTFAVVGDTPGGEFILKPRTVAAISQTSHSAGVQAGMAAGGGGGSYHVERLIGQLNSTLRLMPRTISLAIRDGLLQAM